MKGYQKNTDNWAKMKAIDLFQNFIMVHDESIRNEHIFDCLNWETQKSVPEMDEDEMFDGKPPLPREMVFPTWVRMPKPRRQKPPLKERVDYLALWNNSDTHLECREVVCLRAHELRERFPLAKHEKETLPKRLKFLKKENQLSSLEADIVTVLALLELGHLHFDDSWKEDMATERVNFVAKCLQVPVDKVECAVSSNRPLVKRGCLDKNACRLCRFVMDYLKGAVKDPVSKGEHILTETRANAVAWELFPSDVLESAKLAMKLVQSHNGKTPLNILLYGASGSGKTSFVTAMAKKVRRKLYFVDRNVGSGEWGVSDGAASRLGAVRQCSEVVNSKKSLIVVDEADQILSIPGHLAPDLPLAALNSVLEEVTTPVVWIVNTPHERFPFASRTRFDYAIKFEPLTNRQRLALWQGIVKDLKADALFPSATLARWAEQYVLGTQTITRTLKNVVRMKPQPQAAEKLVEQLLVPQCEFLGLKTNDPQLRPAKDYSVEGLNVRGRYSLTQILSAIRRYRENPEGGMDNPRMSLLLAGPPGTGKTEWCKYLAQEFGVRLLVKKGSDLISRWIGETEQNIKQAFQMAKASGAMLFIDEFDGMLTRREMAVRSWEVSQVTEILQQMEAFTGIFLAATNFEKNLDPAVLRRFTFKLTFDYLDETGKILFFERMFQTQLTDEEKSRLSRIENLTPGDYRTVRQALYYLGDAPSNAQRLDALEDESRRKGGKDSAGTCGKIGF